MANKTLIFEYSFEIWKSFFYIKDIDKSNNIKKYIKKVNIEIKLRKNLLQYKKHNHKIKGKK